MNEDKRSIDRRTFLHGGAVAACALAAATIRPSRAAQPSGGTSKVAPIPLREKFFGCIAGCHIGSSMGAVVEGWPWERIEREHGTLDRLLPYEHYGNRWVRAPGTTEDGVERQKLMITAILEKQDRVTAEDVRRIWVRDIKPEAPGNVSEPFEGMLLAIAKTSLPAADIGKYCDYAGLVSMARSCHPLGLINAGDVAGAIQDVREVGQLYQTANSRGIRWAEVTVIGIAAATKPGATAESVLAAILEHCDRSVRGEIDRGLKLTADCKDFRDMRKRFDDVYSGRGIPYAQSFANEVVTKAVCIFRMTRGNTWEAMKAAVNMGRDTDCLTSVAAGMSGALSGAASVPEELIRQVDRATGLNKFTNSKRTLRETADGLYNAFKARLARLRAYAEAMDAA
jgi:ADP-ribosylglycohydrolase